MPRISQAMLDITFYLYESRADAETGSNFGGTGFFCGINVAWVSAVPHFYAVTNLHLIQAGFSVIRLHKKDGGTEIFEFDPSEWEFLPGGDDVAAIRVPIDPSVHRIQVVDTYRFACGRRFIDQNIGVGDDVFMVGRFVDHDGGSINRPAARFGNISVMPAPIYLEEIKRERNYYCIDLHSRTGFSGSPVFVYRTLGQDLTGDDLFKLSIELKHGTSFRWEDYRPYLALLGIHCAQFPEEFTMKLRDKMGTKQDDHRILLGLSGMTMVAPADGILDLLDGTKLSAERNRIDNEIRSQNKI